MSPDDIKSTEPPRLLEEPVEPCEGCGNDRPGRCCAPDCPTQSTPRCCPVCDCEQLEEVQASDEGHVRLQCVNCSYGPGSPHPESRVTAPEDEDVYALWDECRQKEEP